MLISRKAARILRNVQPEQRCPAIQNITNLSGHADGMIVSVRGDVKKSTSNGAQIASNANAITAGVRQGRGAAGKLLTDKAVASDVTTTLSNVKQTTANADQASQKVNTMLSEVQQEDLPDVHQTIDNTQDITAQLNQAVGTFLSKGSNNENAATALRDTVHGAQQTMTNMADDTEAVKHNFFLRGFFKCRGFYNLDQITSSKYSILFQAGGSWVTKIPFSWNTSYGASGPFGS